jgi:hypothetical protein
MKFISTPSGVLGAVLAGLLGLSGCGTTLPPDSLAEAVRMGERPVAMRGRADFFAGQIAATVDISRGIGRGRDRRGPGGAGLGEAGSPGDHYRRSGERAEMGGDPEAAMAYRQAKLALGSPLPPVTTRLRLENRGTEPVEIEISEVNSDLGNFAVRPSKLRIDPGQTLEPDPMISQLGVTSDEIPVQVTLRRGGVKDTQILKVLQVAKPVAPGSANE